MNDQTFTFDVLRGLWASCYGPQVALLAEDSQEDGDEARPRPFVPKDRKPDEVYIYGELVSENMGGMLKFFGINYFTTASTARQQIADAGDSLLLRVNSPGGSIDVAAAIRVRLQEYIRDGGQVRALVEGMDASASTLVTQTASEIEMSDMGSMMIHRARGPIPMDKYFYTAPQMENELIPELVKRTKYIYEQDEAMARIYADKTGDSVQSWLDLMDTNTYFSAKSAMDKGLVDAIFE